MKNKKILLAILAIALVFGMTLAGCASTSNTVEGYSVEGNHDEKVIRITGIEDSQYSIYTTGGAVICIVPAGKRVFLNNANGGTANSLNPPDYIRTLPANTLAFGLYNKKNRWTGNGVYDLWLYEGKSTSGASTIWKAASIDISTETTTVTWDKFTKVK